MAPSWRSPEGRSKFRHAELLTRALPPTSKGYWLSTGEEPVRGTGLYSEAPAGRADASAKETRGATHAKVLLEDQFGAVEAIQL